MDEQAVVPTCTDKSTSVLGLETELDGVSADPLLPPRPRPSFYDKRRQTWVLSQYDDVLAALREPRLVLRDRHEAETDVGDVRLRTRAEIRRALSAAKLAEWRARIEPLAFRLIDDLPRNAPIEIASEFAWPWCLLTAMTVTGARPADSAKLERLARRVSQATADSSDSSVESKSGRADAELKQYFERGAIPMGGPAFVALSQTLPAFLVNAWLALLRHPVELARLRAQPELIGRAIEELFRYAGLARKVSREATASVSVAGIQMSKGERAKLLLASANRDPKEFPEPDHLDITRDAAGQVAFGAGPHSCVGASLIRMAAAIATAVFARAVAAIDETKTIEWRGGSSFQCASALYVYLNHT